MWVHCTERLPAKCRGKCTTAGVGTRDREGEQRRDTSASALPPSLPLPMSNKALSHNTNNPEIVRLGFAAQWHHMKTLYPQGEGRPYNTTTQQPEGGPHRVVGCTSSTHHPSHPQHSPSRAIITLCLGSRGGTTPTHPTDTLRDPWTQHSTRSIWLTLGTPQGCCTAHSRCCCCYRRRGISAKGKYSPHAAFFTHQDKSGASHSQHPSTNTTPPHRGGGNDCSI